MGLQDPLLLSEKIPSNIQKLLVQRQVPPLKTYCVNLCIKSPLEIYDFGKHSLNSYQRYFLDFYSPKSIYLTPQECRERDILGNGKMPYKKALSEFIFINPFYQSIEHLKKELNSETLFNSDSDDKAELVKCVAYQRLIRYLESEGHDGFSYKNDCEDKGQKSYIIFRPEQVFQKGETIHEIPQISKENLLFLHQLEDSFFKPQGIIPPYQRRELNRQIRAKHLSKLTK